jgi:glycosyltransferase involved in cell wall biosynthesis
MGAPPNFPTKDGGSYGVNENRSVSPVADLIEQGANKFEDKIAGAQGAPKTRLVVLQNYPVPYRTPILNALNDLFHLDVIYLAKAHTLDPFKNPWGEDPRFRYSFWRSVNLGSKRRDIRVQLSVGVSRRLSALRPDVVLYSSWGPLTWEPALWCRRNNAVAVMWSESTSWSGIARGSFSNWARARVVSATTRFVANGSESANYLVELGADERVITVGRLPSALVPSSTSAITGSWGTRFLFVGRLIDRKQPLQLLEAFRRVRKRFPSAMLTFVGDGPLEAALRQRLSNEDNENVTLAGRLEGERLSKAFGEADSLVVPSRREVWGLVVNEGLAHGLYVIASDEVGAAPDLLDSSTGAIISSTDQTALVEAMSYVCSRTGLLRESRQERSRSVAAVTPQEFATCIERAARAAIDDDNTSR